ncbi:MAG TPA: nitroreductase family deazaflavin-dependent oxidoreductase [Pseudonocardiaceae bacterium]
MVLSKRVAAFNNRVTNRITGPVAGHLPGFGIVIHTGRKSGREYRTPVNVFAIPGGYLLALTYGPKTDWVRNVLAAGGCDLQTHGHSEHLRSPELLHDPTRQAMPWAVRQILGVIGVEDFLRLSKD